MTQLRPSYIRHKAVWGPKRIVWPVLLVLLGFAPIASAKDGHTRQAPSQRPATPGSSVKGYKLDRELARRANGGRGGDVTPVILELVPGAQLPPEFKKYAKNLKLEIINGQVLDLPNHELKKIAAHPNIFRVHYDRPLKTQNYRTAVTVGARNVFAKYGYLGTGVGIAVIDSGITTWHDDLINYTSKIFPYGNQRVAKFVDFVNGRTLPYDDNGHGTHVSGIIAGLGYDSNNYEKAGIAPLASLVSLKVLDQNGVGSVSRLIAALNWVAVNAKTYNIRVVNMSVGAGVYESYWTDPLTLAAKAVTDKGITVVAAAGNMGKNAAGQLQYGAITAPANAPWVLTVGASSTMGTTSRQDDQMAAYSSSGPTAIDFAAKPDLVAPGTGTVSLLSLGSTFAVTKASSIVLGKNLLPRYLSLSGTSMAAPVVSGTVALMLEANPNLTPNLIKAILQYTSEEHSAYSPLREGAGFLNTYGAVQLARFFATAKVGSPLVLDGTWSRSVIWGNHRLLGGIIKPTANAWANNIVWGSAKTLGDTGDNIVWGSMAGDGDNIVWGSAAEGDNIVWGAMSDGDNIVWGSATDGDNIVWGSDCGGADCDNVVWGSADVGDNVIWGTAEAGDNIVWGSSDGGDNIVWGSSGPDVTWASDSGDDAMEFPDVSDPLPSVILDFGNPSVPSTFPLGGF